MTPTRVPKECGYGNFTRRSRTGSVVVCVAPSPARGSLWHKPLTHGIGPAMCLAGVGHTPIPSHPPPPQQQPSPPAQPHSPTHLSRIPRLFPLHFQKSPGHTQPSPGDPCAVYHKRCQVLHCPAVGPNMTHIISSCPCAASFPPCLHVYGGVRRVGACSNCRPHSPHTSKNGRVGGWRTAGGSGL